MKDMTRRDAIRSAAALGAALAWPSAFAQGGKTESVERPDVYPQGIASADPHPDSVLLWTRRPPNSTPARRLAVEVANDDSFQRIVSRTSVDLSSENDWTCRVLAGGLAPSRVYWYRFIDEHGFASPLGRTITAPLESDPRPVRFAWVSCQNVTQGSCNAYRRMIWEDERASETDRIGFVMHLGDFVYELVWYPEDRPQGMYDRKLKDVVRYPDGEKIEDFHVPRTVEDYRALYRGYLSDPDLQTARARWPFVCLWDNHEFSWKGWQSQQNFGQVRPAQTRKVAANQAWFEYQPARVVKEGPAGSDRFQAPAVSDTPVVAFDDHGLGLEPGNLAAITSLRIFRAFRWGKNVDVILTDNRSYRSEPVVDRAEIAAFQSKEFPWFVPEDVVDVLDGGRANAGGHPPETIRFRGTDSPNPRKSSPPQSMLGAAQKAWFLDRLKTSTAPWKLWGNTVSMLDWRTDLQNLPKDRPRWPGETFGLFPSDDWSTYRTERAEILDWVKRHGIAGFATLAGDRHAFLAGFLSPTLPPKGFDPRGVEFVVGSISAPGLAEAAKYAIPKDHPLRPIYLYDAPGDGSPRPAINVSLQHGVLASLELQRSNDPKRAIAVRNPSVAPHLAFTDLGGHGYATVRATPDDLAVEFVCIPRPIERSERSDGGPLAYRVSHRVRRWEAGSRPRLERTSSEGEMPPTLDSL